MKMKIVFVENVQKKILFLLGLSTSINKIVLVGYRFLFAFLGAFYAFGPWNFWVKLLSFLRVYSDANIKRQKTEIKSLNRGLTTLGLEYLTSI